MLTSRQLVQSIKPRDWFVTIDLRDAYFHIPIYPRHQRFLLFAFRGKAFQFCALPFGLALTQSFKGGSKARMPPSSVTFTSPSFCGEQRQKHFEPQPNRTFSGHDTRLHLNDGRPVSRKNKGHQLVRKSVQAKAKSLVSSLPKTVGHDGICCDRPATGNVAHAPFSNVVSLLKTQFRQEQLPKSDGRLQMQEGPGDLEDATILHSGGPNGHSNAPRSGNHRRLHNGMGCAQGCSGKIRGG